MTVKPANTKTSNPKRARSKKIKELTKSRHNKNNIVASKYREQMIAKAAYFKALNRDFQGDSCVEDWLEAEKEVDTSISDE